MTYATNLWIYFTLLFGIIILPGMDMLYVLTNALTGGRRARASPPPAASWPAARSTRCSARSASAC